MKKTTTAQELYQRACERFSTYPVGQRHPPLLGVAIAAYNAGFREETALAAELKAMWAKHGQGSVDENDCNNTARTAIKMAEEQGGYIEPKSTVSKEEKQAQKQQAKLVEAHRKRWEAWVKDIMAAPLIVDHADEVESTDDQEQRMKDTIEKLVPDLAKDERPGGICNYHELSWWVLGWQAWGILLGYMADKPRIGSPHVGR